MSKPTFVFLPGAWHTTAVYDRVRSLLSKDSYATLAIALPSLAPRQRLRDFGDDVSAIRERLTALADEGKEVILVMHSYAGLPGAEALEGLGSADRARKGLRGGVVRLVFVMAFVVPEGFRIAAEGDVSQMPPHMKFDVEADLVYVDPGLAKSVFYDDLASDVADQWVSKLQSHSLGVFYSKTTYAAWRFIPSTFVICENDRSFYLPYVRAMLQTAQESRPSMIDAVESLDAGHFPFLSQPEKTVEILKKAAGETTT